MKPLRIEHFREFLNQGLLYVVTYMLFWFFWWVEGGFPFHKRIAFVYGLPCVYCAMLPYVQYGHSEQGLPKKSPPSPEIFLCYRSSPSVGGGQIFSGFSNKVREKMVLLYHSSKLSATEGGHGKNSSSLLPLRDQQPFYPPRKAQNALLLFCCFFGRSASCP